MSLYHFSLGHVSRGAGQSAVASAAYISGGELYSEYYGEWSDYTRVTPGNPREPLIMFKMENETTSDFLIILFPIHQSTWLDMPF